MRIPKTYCIPTIGNAGATQLLGIIPSQAASDSTLRTDQCNECKVLHCEILGLSGQECTEYCRPQCTH